MRSAIYGAGSLGTVLGAYLSRNGVEIDLINRNRDHVEALNRNGARITGTVDMTVPVKPDGWLCGGVGGHDDGAGRMQADIGTGQPVFPYGRYARNPG